MQLSPNVPVDIELFEDIPRCFKLELEEFEHPVVITVKYENL